MNKLLIYFFSAEWVNLLRFLDFESYLVRVLLCKRSKGFTYALFKYFYSFFFLRKKQVNL